MKHYSTMLWISIICFTISCGGNKLKTDEKALAKQILTEEEQLTKEEAVREARDKQLADSIAKLPKGFRFKEDRSIDPNNPPSVIDIIGSRTKAQQKIKLSQLFNKIEYIRLDLLPDSSFYTGNTGWLANRKYVFGYSSNGIVQYDHKGKFIKYICKNESHSTKIQGMEMVTEEDWKMFIGSSQPRLLNDRLYYRYEDRRAGFASLMEYNPIEEDAQVALLVQENNKKNIKGLGKEIGILKARKQMTERPMFVPIGSQFIGCNFIGKSLESKKIFFIVTNSSTGDTVCAFKDNDPIKNFTRSVYRGVDDGYSYHFNGTFHLRQSFNDTIYQLIPPNRMVPKYILDFGSMRIQSAMEGVDPTYSLKDKLVPQSFLETSRYLFITYTKDYECPNTAKQGTLKFSRLIYDKKNRKIISIYQDEKPVLSKGGDMAWASAPDLNIENDIDAMPFKWPELVTSNDQVFSIFSGKELIKLNVPNFPVRDIRANDRIIAIYH